ncbi:stage III sporulation protein AC [Mobilitalea sibirica]|uniref:Stage III sporulation protein AC n=1 Tax=Mobilitalea sibirica TaxID=1462919 RepID=A0A8J7H1F6_9FIRM|nr:stage III sporulation protein AC [Mobilitalea sibirica]MBH1940198.1 stage III sporulation protein AC [Mobilitalea sibirica]
MDINLILRIAVVGILVSILNQILKQSGRDELAFLTSLGGLVLVLFWMLPYITDLFMTIQKLFTLFN